jgi:tRNA1(Val) A37 N6-methylase TrmN6
MKEYNICPKRIKFIYPKTNKEANHILIEGMKNGKGNAVVEAPLFIHKEDSTYTEEFIKYIKGE